jgi:hypothetical protein
VSEDPASQFFVGSLEAVTIPDNWFVKSSFDDIPTCELELSTERVMTSEGTRYVLELFDEDDHVWRLLDVPHDPRGPSKEELPVVDWDEASKWLYLLATKLPALLRVADPESRGTVRECLEAAGTALGDC